MQQLTCPWCGPRSQTEFEYLCDASAIDTDFESESTETALERIFLRDDDIGFHQEIWQHVFGCRGWLKVERHNLTHEIQQVEACRDNGTVSQTESGEL